MCKLFKYASSLFKKNCKISCISDDSNLLLFIREKVKLFKHFYTSSFTSYTSLLPDIIFSEASKNPLQKSQLEAKPCGSNPCTWLYLQVVL